MFEELQAYCSRGDVGGFLPAVKQIANVAALPGIVKARMQLHACRPATAAYRTHACRTDPLRLVHARQPHHHARH